LRCQCAQKGRDIHFEGTHTDARNLEQLLRGAGQLSAGVLHGVSRALQQEARAPVVTEACPLRVDLFLACSCEVTQRWPARHPTDEVVADALYLRLLQH
jgi:hypothetical protein